MATQSRPISLRALLQMVIFIIIVPLLPVLISGRWGWGEGWAFAAIGILGFLLSRLLVARKHPDLIKERARFTQQPDAKPWDKVLSPLVGLGGGLIPLVAGLDERLGWSEPFNRELKIAALVMILAGYAIASYALIENRFFSGVVRIQVERGHKVVSSGPYGWVRHPGYAGSLLNYLAVPFFLDASWALLPALLISIALVVRTAMEDRTLQEELPGYREYARKVRYRLLPGIW